MRQRRCAWTVLLLSTITTPALADPPAPTGDSATPADDADAARTLSPPRSPPAAGPPSAPAADGAAATSMVRVSFTVRSAGERASLHVRKQGAGQSATDAYFEQLCSAPCESSVPSGSTLRVRMVGAADRDVVLSATLGSDVEIEAGARKNPVAIGAGLGLALVGLTVGALGVGASTKTTDNCSEADPAYNTCKEDAYDRRARGPIYVGVGAGLIVAAVILVAVAPWTTNVLTRRRVALAPITRTAGLRGDGDGRTRAFTGPDAPFTLRFAF